VCLPLPLLLVKNPSPEQAIDLSLQFPDEESDDVITLLLKEGKTSGSEEDLERKL
jgi:hypothetical protein